METQIVPNVWIMRVSPGGIDKLQETLDTDQLILGWAKIPDLLSTSTHTDFFRDTKEKLELYYKEKNQRKLGSWSGSIHRFIKDMKKGDYVLIPASRSFYISRLCEDHAIYLENKVKEDSAYRRKVEWLNNKEAIPRNKASAAIQNRLKSRHTIISGYGLLEDVNNLVKEIFSGEIKSFYQEFKQSLTQKALEILHNGKMNPLEFEKLIEKLLKSMGASIIPKGIDNGIDVKALFQIESLFSIQVAVQAKYFWPEPPVSPIAVHQLINGIHHSSFNTDVPTIGMVITTGKFDEDVKRVRDEYMNSDECKCFDFRLIDGEELAELLVANQVL